MKVKVELKGRVAPGQQGWRPVGLFGFSWPLLEVRAVPGLLHVLRWVVVDGGASRVLCACGHGRQGKTCFAHPKLLGGFNLGPFGPCR